MTFAALGDLLDPVVDEVLDEDPSMQRSALRTALLRAAPGDELGLRSARGCTRHAGVPWRLGSRPSGSACDRRRSMARSILRDRPSLRRAATEDEPIGVLASMRPGREEESCVDPGDA